MMTFQQFQRLVSGGEKANVDFKLSCNAFNRAAGDHDKARAELIKDVCAMANNGSAASYLVIGVGDDGQTFRSVTDPNLKSENLQSLVRDAIQPRPFVRLHHLEWASAPQPYQNVHFILIQIGPNARHAFRLAKDLIDSKKGYHFRKNEVWVRNQDTSDLATPEQIIGLMGRQRVRGIESDPPFAITHYLKLAKADQLRMLAADTKELFRELGIRTVEPSQKSGSDKKLEPCFWVVLPVRGKKLLFRCRFCEDMRRKGAQATAVALDWRLEHGLWTFLLGNFSSTAAFSGVTVDVKEPWGFVHQMIPTTIGWVRSGSFLPKGFGEAPITCLSLPKLSDTAKLRASVAEALESLEGDESLFAHVDRAQSAWNAELRRWERKAPSLLESEWLDHERESPKLFGQRIAAIGALIDGFA